MARSKREGRVEYLGNTWWENSRFSALDTQQLGCKGATAAGV